MKVNKKSKQETDVTQLVYDKIRTAVREQYSKVANSGQSGCCGSNSSCCSDSSLDKKQRDEKKTSMELGYTNRDVNNVPEGANMGLGCGNPQAIASLKSAETVLDLGSGGGFDCFLATQEIGESGKIIGVDMTSDMVSKARSNAHKGSYKNIDFRLGEIENLPVADAIVDVIISNCVINLSPDKAKVFQEAFRVLKPGGRLAISDVVAFAELPETVKSNMEAYTSCLAGASSIVEVEMMLKKAGFNAINIKPKDESKNFIKNWLPESNMENYVVSAIIEAFKPAV